MKYKTNKLKKLEKNRFSLFTDDLDHCYLCGTNYQMTIHEIFDGRNRQNSMRYGLCLPLCIKCHMKIQNNAVFTQKWHIKGQQEFNKTYDKDFVSIFYKNYI